MSHDVDEMNSIGAEINKQIKEHGVYNISVENVIEGVQRLKLGKSDGEEGLNSDHIVHSPKILYVFNSMLVHWHSPDSMLVGTMVLLPKDKRQLACTSDNFRAITAMLPNCLLLLYYLKNNMRLQHRICN